MVTGEVEESSIIITACRRLAPAAMGIGISGKDREEGIVDDKLSEMEST